MKAIENIRAHFTAIGRRHIDVPEWGEKGADGEVIVPLRIYFTPLTLTEQQKLSNVGENTGWHIRFADAIILKAQDEQGKPMFTLDDKHTLCHQTEAHVLNRVAAQLLSAPTTEEAAKN